MQTALVIFNGLKFPYYLMGYALAMSKQQGASLHMLFLKAKKELTESYGFPNDLKVAETIFTVDDAQKGDIAIVNHFLDLAVDMAKSEKVSWTNELITDCSLNKALEIIKKFDITYIDAAFDNDNTSTVNNTQFTLADLMQQASSSIKLVLEKDDPGNTKSGF